MKTFLILLVIGIHTAVAPAWSEDSFIRDGSIGKADPPKETAISPLVPFRPITQWVGERFIFLPSTKGLRKYGYQSISVGKGDFGHPTYQEMVGRTAEVIEVQKKVGVHIVTLRMQDSGQTYSAEAITESIRGIAPLADLQAARTSWKGKTVWYKDNMLHTYDEEKDTFYEPFIKRMRPVTIVDVVASWDEYRPVRIVIRFEPGEEGFVDVNVSGTNVPTILRDMHTFDEHFFSQNPRMLYPWPKEVWGAIEESKLVVGMNAEQVRLSRGRPKDISRTESAMGKSEHWTYHTGESLYFENDRLTMIRK